ncbi:MAG: hypothetical protein WDN08_15770 [Rhizomicrobium sp.]
MARMKREPEFAAAMLREGVAALFDGELAAGKHMLRDYVNGTLGFEKLAKKNQTADQKPDAHAWTVRQSADEQPFRRHRCLAKTRGH